MFCWMKFCTRPYEGSFGACLRGMQVSSWQYSAAEHEAGRTLKACGLALSNRSTALPGMHHIISCEGILPVECCAPRGTQSTPFRRLGLAVEGANRLHTESREILHQLLGAMATAPAAPFRSCCSCGPSCSQSDQAMLNQPIFMRNSQTLFQDCSPYMHFQTLGRGIKLCNWLR